MSLLGYLFLLCGVAALLLAAVGLFVLPDPLARQHAATKAGALGIVLIVTGAALVAGTLAWGWRAAVIVILVWLTMPIASHVLARAGLREKPPPPTPAPSEERR